MTADLVFIQRSRVGRCVFRLRADAIDVNAQSLQPGDGEPRLLRTLDPEFTLHAKRFHALYLWPLLLSLISGVISFAILREEHLPNDLAYHPVIFAVLALAGVLRGLPRLEFYLFRDHWKRPALVVVREKSQGAECDAFISELSLRIQLANADELPPAAAAVAPLSAVRLPAPPDFSVLGQGEYRWMASLLSGIVAAALPLLPDDNDAMASVFELLAYVAPIAGTCLGVLSLVRKEHHRYLALVGVALSLCAPFFFRWRL